MGLANGKMVDLRNMNVSGMVDFYGINVSNSQDECEPVLGGCILNITSRGG